MTPPTDFRSVLRNEVQLTRVGSVLVLALMLVGMVTFVLARTAVKVEASSVAVLKALDAVDAAEAQFTRDLLLAQMGLRPASDALDRDDAVLRASLHRLSDVTAPGDPLVARIDDRVEEKVATAQRLAQGRADLHASLARLLDVDDRLAAAEPGLRIALANVDTSLRGLTEGGDPEAVRRAAAQIDGVARLQVGPERRDDLDDLVRCARQVLGLLPVVDDLVGQASSASLGPLLDEKREGMRHGRLQEQHRVGALLFALYALAVLVGAALVGAGHVLSRRTRALRAMAVVEQVTAEVSNLLMSCEPDEVEDRFEQALGLLGRACLFDRACILATDGTDAVWQWRRDDVRPADGWPLMLRGELDAIDAAPAAAFRLPGETFRPSPGLRAQLETAGIRRWSCAKVKGTGQTVALLCLDRSESRLPGLAETEDALTMLAEVIGHALMRKDLHRRHRVLEGKLRRAERLEAVGTFASGIAHNFNNVLGVIAGQVELATDALRDGAPALAHLRQIGQAGHRAQEMVHEILAFGRPERKNVRLVSVSSVVAEAVAQVGVTLPDAAQLTMTGDGLAGATLASEAQLQQVFVNLIQNAVQASPADRRVAVALDAVASGPGRLSHGDLAPGPYLRVAVTDTGEGMSEATQAQLFQPFFSTRPAGTGLGLATALETVRQAGGGVHVRSAPGRGARFEVWLPQVSGGVDAHAPAASARTVLLINPDPEGLRRDEDFVAALGYEPVGFAASGAALHMLATAPDRYDAVIVEHMTAARWMDLQFFRTVRIASAPGAPIVLSTASIDVDAVALTRLGVTDVVRRPWQMSALTEALRGPDGRCHRTPCQDLRALPA